MAKRRPFLAACQWRYSLAVVLLSLSGCGNGSQHCKIGRATTLDLQAEDGHIYTTAMLNGVTLHMVVDTGAALTTVTKASADRMGLGLTYAGQMSGLGGHADAYTFNTRSFQIGALSGTHFALAVADTGSHDENAFADGLLGADFLAAYDLDLDIPEAKATLFKVVSGCNAPVAVLDQPLYYAPLYKPADSYDVRPMVRVQVGQTRFVALIDSGAANTVMFRNAARRIGLNMNDLQHETHIASGGIGPRRVEGIVHAFPPITIGEITLSHLPVAILDQRTDEDGVDMLLGMDFLSRVHAWISFSSTTLIMQYPPKASPSL